MSLKKLLIMGAGGLGTEACWVADAENKSEKGPQWEILGFLDDNPERRGETVQGYKILGTPDQASKQYSANVYFHCALGKNRARETVSMRLEEFGWIPATLIHPTVVIGPEVEIGVGTFVGPYSVIAPSAKIGRYVSINTFVGIGHHSEMGDFSQACPGSRINGFCKVDRLGLIGSNSVLNPGVTVGEAAVVGSSSLAVRNVAPLVTVLGVPARIISKPATSESTAI